jgi:purine-nucleoside phosphorylase
MLVTDHINFIGKRGLFTSAELVERRAGRRVPHCYSPRLRGLLLEASMRARVKVHLGILMGSHGPTYETAAEVRMAQRFGGDAACMSTVHEVLAAAQIGCECASLSCVTNLATGLSGGPLTHHEVTEVADRAASKLKAVLDEFTRAEAATLAQDHARRS